MGRGKKRNCLEHRSQEGKYVPFFGSQRQQNQSKKRKEERVNYCNSEPEAEACSASPPLEQGSPGCMAIEYTSLWPLNTPIPVETADTNGNRSSGRSEPQEEEQEELVMDGLSSPLASCGFPITTSTQLSQPPSPALTTFHQPHQHSPDSSQTSCLHSSSPLTCPPSQLPTSPPSQLPASPPSQLPASPPSQLPASPPSQLPTSPPSQLPTSPPSQLPTSPPSHPHASPPTHPPISLITNLLTSPPCLPHAGELTQGGRGDKNGIGDGKPQDERVAYGELEAIEVIQEPSKKGSPPPCYGVQEDSLQITGGSEREQSCSVPGLLLPSPRQLSMQTSSNLHNSEQQTSYTSQPGASSLEDQLFLRTPSNTNSVTMGTTTNPTPLPSAAVLQGISSELAKLNASLSKARKELDAIRESCYRSRFKSHALRRL